MDSDTIVSIEKITALVKTFTNLNSYESLIDTIKKNIDNIAKNDSTGLYLYDEDEKKLKLFYAKGFSAQEKQEAENSAMDRHPGHVFRTAETLWINDQDTEKNPISIDSKKKSHTRSRIYVPVVSNNKTIGAFGIQSEKPYAYTEKDLALLKLFASLAADAYESIKKNILITKQNEENTKLSLLAKNTTNNVIYADKYGKITWVNKHFEETTGYFLDEIIGKTPGSFLIGKDTDAEKTNEIRTAILNKKACNTTILNYKKNGEPFIVTIQLNPVFNETGDLINFVAIQEDVTEAEKQKDTIKHKNKQLKLRTQAYNNIVNNTSDCIVTLDARGQIKFANSSWLQKMNYQLNEVIGTTIFSHIHPDSQEHCMLLFNNIDNPKNKSFAIQYNLINKNKVKIEVEGEVVNIYKNKRLYSINSYIKDVTEINKLRIEKEIKIVQLKENKERLENVLGSLSESVWGVSLPNYKLEYISDSAVSIYGYPLQNWYDNINLWSDSIHPEDKEFVLKESEKLFDVGQVFSEYRIITADKKEKWINSETKIITNEKGIPILMTGITRDVTEKKLIEIELKNYKIAIDESAILSITNLKGEITFANDKFCKISQYSREELVGENHRKINSGFHPPEFFHEMWKVISNGNIWKGEIRNKAKDGSYYFVESTIIPFMKNGVPFQYISIRYDSTEKVKAKLDVDEQKQFYETILNNIPGNVAVYDIKGNYIFINPNTVKDPVLRKWLIGKNNYDYCRYRGVSSEVADERNKQFELLEANGYSITSIEEKKLKDGSNAYMNSTMNIIEYKGEKLIIAYGLDVTEIKNAEIEITRLKIFYETILNNIPIDIAIFDNDHRYIYVNKIAIKNDTLREYILGKDDFEYAAYRGIDSKSAILRRASFIESKESKRLITWEDVINVSNKKTITMLRSFYPVMETETKLKLMIGYGMDVSSVKENQLKVIKNEAKINLIMRSALDAILIINSKGIITFTNPAVFDVFGFSEQELLNTRLTDNIMPTRYAAEHPTRLPNYSPPDKSITLNALTEQTAIRKDGSEILIEISNIPIEIDGEASFCFFIRDITKKKEAEIKIADLNKNLEEKVRQRTTQLEVAIKELDSFSYSVSHDLKSPLRGIAGYSSALLEDYRNQLDKEGVSFITKISESTTFMNRLIDDLLTLSKIGRYQLSKTSVQLTELSKDVFYRILETHSRNDVKLKIEDNLVLNCDKNLFTILLTNLISNAIKFSSKKATPIVEIGSMADPAGTIFYIKDNGAGFDLQFADKLFGAFQRLHTKSEFEGTGIGLATVMRIINMHEGKIWTDSKVDEGATFFFQL